MAELHSDLPSIELVTESAWIGGYLAREQVSDAANLASVLNLQEYGLRGRSLVESGRLVDVLNRESGYVSVTAARIQPLFPLELLDRTVDAIAVNTPEILCAAPMQPSVRGAVEEDAQTRPSAGKVEWELRRVELQIGPILVRGDLHVVPGTDPVAAYFQREWAFIPLTNATAIYLPEPNRKWVREVLIVSRRRTQILISEPEP